jgi:hypothetical protein
MEFYINLLKTFFHTWKYMLETPLEIDFIYLGNK